MSPHRRLGLAATLAIVALACQSPTATGPAGKRRPNVVIVITDDQGYGDVGAHGNPMIQTPAMDQLWSESVRLTDFHVDPTCSPSRSAIMSGRYSTRTGVWHTIMGRSLMDDQEVTLAELCQDAGYRTGMFGKWHLGDNWPLRPQDQGFERVTWHHGGGIGQGPDHWGNDYFDDTYEVDGVERQFDGYCTDVWFSEARDFVAEDDDRPFLLYLATNAPHGPYFVDESYSQPYRDKGCAATMSRFYGMITNIDENLGRLRADLEERGLADNTIFVFMTDNGSAAGHAVPRKKEQEGTTWFGFNSGMRGNKGSEYDGGHRVPCFVRWPDGGIGGGRDVPGLTAHVDLLPTLAELCSIDTSATRPLDGMSLAGALSAPSETVPERTLFVHSQRLENTVKWRKAAVMRDRWRLVGRTELYHLDSDPGQKTNVADAHPELVKELSAAYDGWWDSLAQAMKGVVRIGVGGAESPTRLMSHDWHSTDDRVAWHQNHVRNGAIVNGTWALDVAKAGTYRITLFRWPREERRAMGSTWAEIQVGAITKEQSLGEDAAVATFDVELPKGPVDLKGTLQRADGKKHGAYFVDVERL